MKKSLLLVCLLFSAMMLFALEKKKVAILEVQDTENVLEPGQKLMLQSSLAKAVAKTPGYEAFDRTSMEKLLEEQLFQQSGFVDDNSKICEAGKMAGASYIMVSEAAKTADRMVVVGVKLLNVETAKVELSESIVLSGSSEEMQTKCDQLASSLLDKKRQNKIMIDDSSSKNKEDLTRVGLKYVYNGRNMKSKEYQEFLLSRCTPAYKQFHHGDIMIKSGYAALGLGVLGIGIGAACMASKSNNNVQVAGKALVAIGAISLAGSVTLFTFGVINQRKSVKTFNSQCLSQNYPLRFDMIASQDGIGLAMKF
ncbi:MAG: hypothetical protein IKP02_00865 [Paludibacteraceae bacterium]|nr:hypothetical protein [Paludibacteraceae bacterium]MBR4704138.1 hypothetical protein [Paludibacteraceae bacterium]